MIELNNGLENYQNIMDSFLVDAAIINLDHKIIFQNSPCRKMYGNQSGEYCYRVFTKQDRICQNCPCKEVFTGEQPNVSEKTSFERNGTTSTEI